MHERVSDHVLRVAVASHTLPPADHTNLYVVHGRAGAVLWDAGGRDEASLAPLWEALSALGNPPVLAIGVSHAHPDHCEAAAWLQARLGAPLRGFPATRGRTAASVRALHWGEPLREGDRIQLGDATLEILHTPGHAPDHLAGWIPEDGALLPADLLAGEGTVAIAPPEGDLKLYFESLGRIVALAPRVAGPGHGPVLRDPVAAARETLAHRLERERQVLDGLRAGDRTAAELVRRIYGPGLAERVRPFAEATVRAHLEKLLAEARVRRGGPPGEDASWTIA